MDETGKSTISNVKLVRTDLAKADDAVIQLAIDDAWAVVKRQSFPDDIKEQACRWLAASMINKENERVALEQVGDLKKQYFKGNANPWYSRYVDLLNQFGDGGALRLVVI